MSLLAKLAVAAIVVTAVASCSRSGAEVASEGTTLGDAVFALSLQPQEQEFAEGVNQGFVVLVNPDGEFREVQTEGMDQGKVAIADGELYYMDINQGYFTGPDSTTIVPGSTTDQIEGLLRVSDGYVGVYNEGGDPTGEYRFQVLHTTRTPPAAQLAQVNGYFRAMTACGDEVFGVSHDPSAVPGVLTLNQLHPSERFVDQATFPTAIEFEGLESPCRDNTMYFLGMPTDPEEAPPAQQMLLFAWNVANGSLATVKLTDSLGNPLLQDLEQKLFSRSDAGSLTGATFHWLDGRGRIQATNIATGATTIVATTDYSAQADEGMEVSFEHPGVMLAVQKKNGDDPVILTTWDLATGESTEIMRVPGINTSLARILRDFAYWGDQAPCSPPSC